jgi:hypothetical protein
MEGSTAGFADRLFGLPNQIAIMDHLAEWMRQHLDARNHGPSGGVDA